ncbi:helix-turn-helix transcriptional regulator [Vibrio sagamiensis]|uniref:DNA-binding protein n=1 Tax=Vibrio sagamiensis NBRC 104589 TaxID=1219064 RepID=A0A511QM21_9VIBR|nr:YafY family protein [Vibrio sagamiensis]PNQ64040.1 YafY family transcriptional regulator [Vibrio agarivorans]GEM77562.1 DNA-binding protein [Vibrio sagamiensis NBRC 104589]
MSRSQRLLDLLQLLRRYKYPISAEKLASQLNVSVRTIYRDIATLQAQGADIEGEAGLGYILKPSFYLPPMMFSLEELEALRLGAEWVSKQANGEFREAAIDALAKISAVLPSGHEAKHTESVIRVASVLKAPELMISLTELKATIQKEYKAEIIYQDAKGATSKRVVWPILIGMFGQHNILVAWCEARSDYRNFQLDRIHSFSQLESKYERSRHVLLTEWEAIEGIEYKRLLY